MDEVVEERRHEPDGLHDELIIFPVMGSQFPEIGGQIRAVHFQAQGVIAGVRLFDLRGFAGVVKW